jgi:hypothetical protein
MFTRSTPSHRLLVRLLVAAQVLYVLGVAGAGYATTAYGQHIALATTPVDLHGLQYESFVRLRYTAAEAPLTGGAPRHPSAARPCTCSSPPPPTAWLPWPACTPRS